MKKFILISIINLFVTVSIGHAKIIIDFADGDAAGLGEVCFDGQGNAWGSDIGIDRMTLFGVPGFPTPDNYDVSGDVMGVDPDAGALSFDTRQGNNHFQISGSVPGLGVSHQVLLAGVFSGWEITPMGFEGAYGIDRKSDDLLLAIGLPVDVVWDFYGFVLATDTLIGVPNLPISVDISNTAIPEPASLILIGLGLFAIGAFGRRRILG